MADGVTSLTIVIVTWICYLLIGVMLDQIIELPAIVRLILLAVCVTVTGTILILRVFIPSLSQINARYAAHSIELTDQRMKNSVLSWVELAEHAEELPAPILRTIENKAASDLSRVRIEDAIQPQHILPSLYVLASVVVLFCFYSFFTTKSFVCQSNAFCCPWSQSPHRHPRSCVSSSILDRRIRPSRLPFRPTRP